MSRVLEHHAKRLLASHGLMVPRSVIVTAERDVADAERECGYPAVVKALVPTGKKAKGSGIRFASDRGELAQAVRELLGTTVNEYPVTSLLVEERIGVDRELFVSVSYDSLRRAPRVLLGATGGTEIEDASRTLTGAPAFVQVYVALVDGLKTEQAAAGWRELGFDGEASANLADATVAVWETFAQSEALLIEINPLGLLPDRRACVLGSLFLLDDDALYRHRELAGIAQPGNERSWRVLTPLEREVLAVDASEPYRGTVRYTEMPSGDIANCGAGGGGSLLTFDLLVKYQLRPASYAELGGNPSAAKVRGLMKAVLSRPGIRALLVNTPITNNTQTDEVARGIVAALSDCGIRPGDFPIVIRMAGVNDSAAREVLHAAGLDCYGEEQTMEDAVARLAELVRAMPPAQVQES